MSVPQIDRSAPRRAGRARPMAIRLADDVLHPPANPERIHWLIKDLAQAALLIAILMAAYFVGGGS